MFLIYRWRTAVLAAWSINGKGMRAQEPTACWRKSVFGAEVSWESNFGWIHSPPICTCRIQQQQMAKMVLLMHFLSFISFPSWLLPHVQVLCSMTILNIELQYITCRAHQFFSLHVKYHKLIYFYQWKLNEKWKQMGWCFFFFLICLFNMTF